MAFVATCTTDDCPETGIPKPGTITLDPGEHVWCGGCGQPCDVQDDPAPEPEPEPTPEPHDG